MTVPHARTAVAADLVVRQLAVPDTEVVDPASPLAASMQRELARLYQENGVAHSAVEERDVGPAGAGDRAFLLRYRVLSYDTAVNANSTDTILCLVLMVPTVGLGCIPAASNPAATTHRLRVEVAVYDVRQTPMRAMRAVDTQEMQAQYDTSSLAPLLRRAYVVDMAAFVQQVTGDREIAWHETEGGELARRAYAASIGDVVHAISAQLDRPAAQPQPVAMLSGDAAVDP